MNQFGLGIPKNLQRAERYYQYALLADTKEGDDHANANAAIGGAAGSNNKIAKDTNALEVLPTQLKLMVRSLLWMCSPSTRYEPWRE